MLVTKDDEEMFGDDLIDLIRRAARDAIEPQLTDLRQEISLLNSNAPAGTSSTTAALSWEQLLNARLPLSELFQQIANKLTPLQKASMLAGLLALCFLWMFRYENIATNNLGVVIQRDRWTGSSYLCTAQADRTFKCGK
jgi:hypothetical protein